MRKRIAEEIERNNQKYAEKTDQLPKDSSGRPVRPKGRYDGRGHHPNSQTQVGGRYGKKAVRESENKKPATWVPPANLRGDVSRIVARAVFEMNPNRLYRAYANAALRGNGYVFQQLAERAYGKLKERVEYDITPYSEVPKENLLERLQELKRELNLGGLDDILVAAATDGADREDGGSASDPARTLTPSEPQKD
jgi:hypothetical protein